MLEGEFVWDAQGEFSGTVREAVWQRDIPEF